MSAPRVRLDCAGHRRLPIDAAVGAAGAGAKVLATLVFLGVVGAAVAIGRLIGVIAADGGW